MAAPRPVVVIAPASDEHAVAVRAKLEELGVVARMLDVSRFPHELRITLGDQLGEIWIEGERVAPGSVYLRDLDLRPGTSSALRDEAMRTDWRRATAALHERAELVTSILHRWQLAGVPIYNPLSAFPQITKPYQLARLAAAGLPVPETRWTNDPDEVRRFAERGSLIYKPVVGGAATQRLEARDLTDERLGLLRAAPVCFQELLPGPDLRAFVLDGAIVASWKITTDAIDFRGHEQAVEQITLPDDVQRACIRATEVLGLRFTGMDLKADAHGTIKILELNPSPMFLGFDHRSGSDVLGALATALGARASSVG